MAGYGRIFNIAGATTNYRSLLSSRKNLANVQSYATLKDKTLEKLGIPPKPKRPLTPYFQFMIAERNRVVAENPNLSAPDIVKKLAQEWANCDIKRKSQLQKEYDVEVLAYSKRIMTYEQSITPEQRDIINEAKEKEEDKKLKDKLKKKIEQLGKPKRPPTAFLQYMQERKYTKVKDEKTANWLRSVADLWAKMPLEEKSKYQIETKRLMEQYKKDMREWEEKMVREGHIDVVRNRGLIDLKFKNTEIPE